MLKISYRGHKTEKERAKQFLAEIPCLERMKEPEARLKIQDLIDEHDVKATILVNGNHVWGTKKILRNLDHIIKHGTLYNRLKPEYMPVGSMLRMPVGSKPVLSKYFYDFLHLCCGSMAHHNINGWVYHYPTVRNLKNFFKENEFGKPVRDWIPGWYSDAKRIVEEIEQKLFPFQSYMKTRRSKQ